MILSINEQTTLFILVVGAGMLIGLLYDTIRIFRKIIPHSNIIMQIEDGIYWILVIFFMFIMLLHKNNGQIRVFLIFGAFLGMLLYYLIVSPLVNGISDRVVYVIKYIVKLFFTIVLTPFRLIYIILGRPVGKVNYYLKVKRKKLLHCGRFYVKIKKQGAVRNAKILLRKGCKKK